jgi:hypothetical protein
MLMARRKATESPWFLGEGQKPTGERSEHLLALLADQGQTNKNLTLHGMRRFLPQDRPQQREETKNKLVLSRIDFCF